MRQRIVVKIGSSSLTSEGGSIDHTKVAFLVSELAALHNLGFQVIVVTSGAIAAGYKQIGYKTRPKDVHEKQAASAVGQALLMNAYNKAFSTHQISVAQILLTRYDFSNRKRVHNAIMTLDELIKQNIIPIINENDTVSTEELKFGDNDMLSALVSNLAKVQQLVIITDMDGLYTDDPRKNANAVRIERVEKITEHLYEISGGSGSSIGTGGMRSKIEAARIAMRGGIPVFIGIVADAGDLISAVQGLGKGTYFDTKLNILSMKKQWVGFHSIIQGFIIVDRGAEAALVSGGKSLLPAGVKEIVGDFQTGDVIEVRNLNHHPIGRGIVNYSSSQLKAAAGLSSEEVLKKMNIHRIEVIHRDEWIALVK